jgi:hypothetical protein
MTHFIRDIYNRSLVDCEVTKDDLRCLVVVDHYSRFLLQNHYTKWPEIIQDFTAIQEIRGTWFEATPRPAVPLNEFVADAFKSLIAKYTGLHYVTD